MEEGPEPQEWVEKAAEEHHHGREHGPEEGGPGMKASAITAAMLAVLAAVGSLLSGHAANQAMLAQARVTDQWAFYQATSTKGHVFEVGAEVIASLSGADRGGVDAVKPTLSRFRDEAKRHEHEKDEIKREAEALEAESRHEFRKHHRFALGVALFQVGIVLSSVSILVRYRPLYLLSLLAGGLGLLLLLVGVVG
jgi:hypothetical protein